MAGKEKIDLKVVILGNAGVGKTCLLVRFLDDSFGDTTATIGASYFKKTVISDGAPCSLGLWDTAGQERYDSLSTFYCRGAGCAIITFDITSKSTFHDVKKWFSKLQTSSPNPNCFLILVGTKLDKVMEGSERGVNENEILECQQKIGAIKYIETSAKTGENVKEVFEAIVAAHRSLQKEVQQELKSSEKAEIIGSEKQDQKKGCC